MTTDPASLTAVAGPTSPKPTTAGLGGVGAGTGLVVIAQAIDGRYPIAATVLSYLSPAFAWISGLAIYFVQAQAVRYFERRMVENAKKTLVAQLQSEHTSRQHKARIRKLLEVVETEQAASELARLRQLGLPPSPADSSPGQPAPQPPAPPSMSSTRRRKAKGTDAQA